MKTLIKPAISILLVGTVLYFADLSKLQDTLLAIPPWILAAVTVGYFCGQVLSTTKWWLIARSGGIDVPWIHALRSYFTGTFINCFGLGIVGGDVARALLLSYGRPQKAEAIASVVADRAHGLAVLALIGSIAAAFFGSSANLEPGLLIALAGVGAVLVAGWFIGPALAPKLIPAGNRYRQKIDLMTRVFPRSSRTIVLISAISACFHCLQISLHGLMAYALGASIGWAVLFAVVPFVNIASSLPISWNGLGVREASYAALLVPRGILTSEQALAFGAIWLFAVTCTSAIGGIVSITTGDFVKVRSRESGAEEPLLSEPSAP
jgi:uncharacterized membrane protein YbhN (UPF0104 family)